VGFNAEVGVKQVDLGLGLGHVCEESLELVRTSASDAVASFVGVDEDVVGVIG
jgi:hypothetical protein